MLRDKTNSNYASSGLVGVNRGVEIPLVNFLAYLYCEGYQYQSLNIYRSAISSTHEHAEGTRVGNHPMVTRLLQGVFNSRPPQPRYASFWDVGVVIQHIKDLGDNKDLSLKQLTMKTGML